MAYRFQGTEVPRSPIWHQVAGVGLASPELWSRNHLLPEDPVRDLKNDREDIRRRQAISLRAATSSNELPDELVRLYPDLDNDSRNFLKRGPRSAAERLAYAQQVHLLAHLDAQLAPQSVQREFQDSGALDPSQHFAGPDGRVYVRNEDSEERPGAKIRRGYESAIGGFAIPEIDDSLGQIPEATRSKRADVELYSPPVLPEQEERERLLAEHNINPATWQSGIRGDEEVQRTFKEVGYLWDAIYPWSYVGPDGAIYFKTELTQPEPFSQRRRVRDWQETQEYLRTLPEPTVDELMFRAMAMNGMLPGGRQVRFTNSSGKFVPPNGMDARAEIRARLADIPRQAALHGWGRSQAQKTKDHASRPDPLSERKAQVPRNLEQTINQVVAETAAINKKRKRSDQTKMGVPRDRNTRLRIWKDFVEAWDNVGYENLMSPSNRFKLLLRLSPKVDKHWIAIHPEDAGLRGEVIHIHHVDGSPFTQPLPSTRHSDTHYNRNVGYSNGGIGGQVPFYFEPPPKKPKQPKKRK